MRAICCAILALVFFKYCEFKLSGARITSGDVEVAKVFVGISWGFVAAAVIFCVFGL